MTHELKDHFEGVLNHLADERAVVYRRLTEAQNELRDLDVTIAALRRRIDPMAGITPPQASPQDRRFARMSVRWGTLYLLYQNGPMASADIAKQLLEGGIETQATNFANNVSAVLSTTMKGKREVEMEDGRWKLTETGMTAATHIFTSAKFRKACPWANAPGVTAPGAPTRGL